MSNTNRTSSPGGQNRNATTNAPNSPRWWRLRSNSRNRETANPQPETLRETEEEGLAIRLERLFTQMSPYLPTVSSSTRKAILYIILLIAAWKIIIWTLQLVITGVCFILAMMIILSLLKPDIALYVFAQVLPPHIALAKAWLAQFFNNVAQTLNNSPPTVPQFAIEDTPPTPRSPRTILSRSQQHEPTLLETNA